MGKARLTSTGAFGTTTRSYASAGEAARDAWKPFLLVGAMLLATFLLRDSKWMWAPMAVLFAGGAFWFWMKSVRDARTLAATPRAKVASAAQGYAELGGEALAAAGDVESALTQTPCLWYRYSMERKDAEGGWIPSEAGASEAPFRLEDGTGICDIEPAGFEFLSFRTESWLAGDRRYTEALIIAGDPLYAIGEFRTEEPERHVLRAARGRTSLVSNLSEGELRRKGMVSSGVALAVFLGLTALFGWLLLRTLGRM